ncbi:MAG: endonuclease III, partial [Methanomicrobiales archaeon]|nr:endonuclease III [Methanomicrobiales archaeon]
MTAVRIRPAPFSMHRRRALEIFRTLGKSYPEDVTVGVPFENPFEALILTILSAQTTDRQVGTIRDTLFRRFPTPRDLAGADTEEVESVIRSTGYYHVKAKNIVAAARMILEDF